jgi:hypothetical protein
MDNLKKLATKGTQDEGNQSKTENTIIGGHHYTQANSNNVNKTWSLLKKLLEEKTNRTLFYAEIATDITTSERKDRYILCEFRLKRNCLMLNKKCTTNVMNYNSQYINT